MKKRSPLKDKPLRIPGQIEGEKAVGQFLERLREQGYQVFHELLVE